MKYTPGGRSADIEDRRGSGGRRVPLKLGCGGIVVVGVLSLALGRNLFLDLGGKGRSGDTRPPADDDKLVEFVSFVLDDAQSTWTRLLPEQSQKGYRKAKLVLFTDEVKSACGFAESAIGPFYCSTDEKVYIDLGFYRALRDRLGAPGDFAQAYVIAHEIGHHVQNVLGASQRFRSEQRGKGKEERNQLSVRFELQADCYAGVWAHSTAKRDLLEKGDIEEGLGAAAAIGDDRLQKAATGKVVPETWTHGSSAMRVRWFKRGLEKGRLDGCDTSSASEL